MVASSSSAAGSSGTAGDLAIHPGVDFVPRVESLFEPNAQSRNVLHRRCYSYSTCGSVAALTKNGPPGERGS
jgi:hypothetical protein